MDNVLKEAVTIWLYINKAYHDNDYHSHSYYKVLRRITQKLIEHLKDSKYNFTPHNTGMKLSEHLQFVIDEKEEDEFMIPTYIQMWCHDIIHNYCQDYDPAVKKEYRKTITFYK